MCWCVGIWDDVIHNERLLQFIEHALCNICPVHIGTTAFQDQLGGVINDISHALMADVESCCINDTPVISANIPG